MLNRLIRSKLSVMCVNENEKVQYKSTIFRINILT